MPFKRRSSSRHKSSRSSSSGSSTNPPLKRLRSQTITPFSISTIKIYIVQAKLDAQTVSDLFSIAESYGNRLNGKGKDKDRPLSLELCQTADDAEIIITAIRMRKRLERHVDWKVAKQKAIVTPQWLLDSAKQDQPLPCSDYVALRGLRHDETIDGGCQPLLQSTSSRIPSRSMSPPEVHNTIGSQVNLDYTSRYACARASPLLCPNQGLVAQLETIRHSREVEGEDRNALSYERAIAVIKAYPYPITVQNFHEQVVKLPYLGDKMLSKIEEYISIGEIHESQTTLASSRFQSLCAFTTIYGVGPTTARKLYSLGLRTIEDMEKYYDFSSDFEDTENRLPIDVDGKEGPQGPPPEISIKAGLAFRNEFNQKVPRAEVEEMHAVVTHQLSYIQKGCISTIVGGYRRGKTESNDVDIIFTHSDLKSGGEQVKKLLAKLVRRLHDKGLVTHVMHLSGFHVPNVLRTAKWDSLDKALTVFVLPSDSAHIRVHRRLDLIFTAPEAYWTAVTGWTGSKMFERDLRLWAKEKKGLKFDSSGITRRRDSKRYYPKSEREVFDILGLEWIDPTLRNANA